jgi:hypothetical protein
MFNLSYLLITHLLTYCMHIYLLHTYLRTYVLTYFTPTYIHTYLLCHIIYGMTKISHIVIGINVTLSWLIHVELTLYNLT